MKVKSILAGVAAIALLGVAGAANAVSYVYVGSWAVADGPRWSGADAPGNTPPLSGVETAALLFGGTAANYVTSTLGTSVANIDFKTFLDGYADTQYLTNAQSDTFVGIVGSNYKNGGFGNYSAYVFDHACGIYYCAGGGGEKAINYAFRIGGAPEPASWALMVIGLGGLGAGLRSRRRQGAAA